MGGMGMGGGTLLIPLLAMCAVDQHMAQAINLVAFIPMSVIALFIHNKHGYVSIKRAFPITAVALVGAVGGSFAAGLASGFVLRACFGAFMTLLGLIRLGKAIADIVEKAKAKKMRKKKGET